MLKKKNFLYKKIFFILTLFSKKNFFLYKKNLNNFFIKSNINKIPPFNLTVEFNKTVLLDKVVYNNKNIINIDLYSDDIFNYLSFIINNNYIYSQNKFFINSVFLERESSEFFNIIYKNTNDKRPLLLNYSDFCNILEKKINIQEVKELKTSWLKKKIYFKKSKKIRL